MKKVEMTEDVYILNIGNLKIVKHAAKMVVLFSPWKTPEFCARSCLRAENLLLSLGPLANRGTGRLMGLPHGAFMEQ